MTRYLKFWGTRGSCPVSGPEYSRFGGNTSCLEISYDGVTCIIDAGTGIRPLGAQLIRRKDPIHLILTHMHWDHVIGLPFFDPLYQPDARITIHSRFCTETEPKQALQHLFDPRFFPVSVDQIQANLNYESCKINKPLILSPLEIEFHPAHHTSATSCLKIKTPLQTIGYASDNEAYETFSKDPRTTSRDSSLVKFFSECDVLIHEAQYFADEYIHKSGWGHSSGPNAAALIQQANIPLWLAVHHDPKHTDKDLEKLALTTKGILQEKNIPCDLIWVPDSYLFKLS